MKKVVVMLMVVAGGFGQEQKLIQDLTLLIGKRVTAQRWPLCQPGTYTHVLAYAGKQGKVVSLKPSTITRVSQTSMDKLTPEIRAMLEDAQKASTILVQFEDGTQLDTCGPVGPNMLAKILEVVPGQSFEADSPVPPPPASPPTATSIATAPIATAQPRDVLPDDEVNLALAGKGRDHWVEIQDMGLMAAQGNQVPKLTIYMPEAVLAIQSASARRQFTQYQPTSEEKRRSLMIVAQGYAGKTIADGCTSITRIALVSDPSGGIVQEAYLSEPLGETWRNNFGATNQCQALRVKFSLDDVRKVRAGAPNGEFFVAVFSGIVKTKVYKIKTKHQSKLGLD